MSEPVEQAVPPQFSYVIKMQDDGTVLGRAQNEAGAYSLAGAAATVLVAVMGAGAVFPTLRIEDGSGVLLAVLGKGV